MKKILGIDDNQTNLELLYHILSKHFPEYEFLQALDGIKGIELAKTEKPEIILLDILMPEMNGYEVCQFLKNDNSTFHIPILMISALGNNSDERSKGLNAGADAFISKPFSQKELQAQINVALRIKRAEDLLRITNENLELTIKDQTKQNLRKEERIHQISEHAREFYWETDNKGIFTYISPVVESILEIPTLKIINQMSFIELFQVDELNPFLDISKDVENRNIEIQLKIEESIFWFSLNSFPVFNSKNIFKGKRGVCYDITHRKEVEMKLKRSLSEIEEYQHTIRGLNKEIAVVEEHERKKIAENLHDSLGQTLSLSYLKLSALVNEDLSEKSTKIIDETSNLLKEAITQSRIITYDLSPPMLYELGLFPTFIWKLEQIEKQHAIKATIDGSPDELDGFNKENDIFIFRMVCELLNNIIKHANASEIEFNIIQTTDYFTFIVRDNGVGIKKKKKSASNIEGGFGLKSIHERLKGLNGELSVKPLPNKGTEAIIRIFKNIH